MSIDALVWWCGETIDNYVVKAPLRSNGPSGAPFDEVMVDDFF